jgi:hypothetical protein
VGVFADVVGGVSQLVSMNKNPVSMNGNIYRHFLRKIFL